MTVDLDLIYPNPDQPRKHFAEDALRELAESIGELGVLQPIAVRVVGDRYEIVAGERRWRASQMAGLTEVPVIVVDVPDDDEMFVRSIAENVNRKDMTMIEEADAYQRLSDQGYSVERIAKMLGKRPQDIRWKIDLLRLDPAVRGLVSSGQVPPDLAWYMSELSGSRQIEVVRKWADGDFANGQAAAAYCESVKLVDDQEVFFQIEEIPEVTAKQTRARASTRNKLGMIGSAVERLEEIFAEEDSVIAVNLGPEAERLRVELDGLAKLIGRYKRRAVKIEQMVNAGIGQSSLLP